MPKKFVGENSKAVVARARKAAAKEAETAKKQKEIEDNLWKDDNKLIARKQQKKEAEEQKKQQLLQKKAEAKALLEKEMESIKVTGKQPASKLTRAQIIEEQEKRNKAAEASTGANKKIVTHLDMPLEENINRLSLENEVATNIDEAIQILSNDTQVEDKHPEKRVKAAYTAFEERRMPQLKIENPTLRLSQLKQLLKKEWQKSPENPLNQRLNA